MAYVTPTQVASQFPGVSFDTNTKINSTEIAEWIAEADQEINSRVGLKYEVPITGEKSLLILRTISRKIVGQQVKETLNIKTPAEETTQGGPVDLAKQGRQMLSNIVSGKILLPDAIPVSTSDGVKSFNIDCAIEHTFKRGVEQW